MFLTVLFTGIIMFYVWYLMVGRYTGRSFVLRLAPALFAGCCATSLDLIVKIGAPTLFELAEAFSFFAGASILGGVCIAYLCQSLTAPHTQDRKVCSDKMSIREEYSIDSGR